MLQSNIYSPTQGPYSYTLQNSQVSSTGHTQVSLIRSSRLRPITWMNLEATRHILQSNRIWKMVRVGDGASDAFIRRRSKWTRAITTSPTLRWQSIARCPLRIASFSERRSKAVGRHNVIRHPDLDNYVRGMLGTRYAG